MSHRLSDHKAHVRGAGDGGFSAELVPWDVFAAEQRLFQEAPVVARPAAARPGFANWGLNLNGINVPAFRQDINEVMLSVFGNLIEALGMRSVTSLKDYIAMDAGGRGRIPSKKPHDLFFSAVPAVEHTPSPEKNIMGHNEFVILNGRQAVNDRFWKGHLQHFTPSDKERGERVLRVLELAAFIPTWCLDESQRVDHEDAMSWFQESCCSLKNDWFFLSLYNHYASTFIAIMNSNVVKMGRMLGFRPIFLLRNCLLARTGFGVRNYHFTSVDRGARSSLMLVGFWRYPFDDPKQLQVVGVQVNGSYLTHYTM